MKKKRNVDEGGGPNWLDTYADMVTLLLTFFVLLFSMSTVNAEKWEILVKSFQGRSGQQQQISIEDKAEVAVNPEDEVGDGDNEIAQPIPKTPEDVTDVESLYIYLSNYIKSNNKQADVEVKKGDGFTFITFRNNIFFDGDSSVLRDEGKEILTVLSRGIKPINEKVEIVRCSGHTARARSANSPNIDVLDWELSALRAAHVVSYISQKNVIDKDKLSSVGYGEHHPIVPHDGTEKTRIKNRRVEIFISEKDSATISLDEIYKEIDKLN